MSEDDSEHLADLSDGAGCTEIWEHLSEQRAEADDDASEESTKTETETEGEETEASGEGEQAAEISAV